MPMQLLITSDSGESAAQIKSSVVGDVEWVGVLPEACHIQFNATNECFSSTVTQWFLMSFSDILISQYDPKTGAPHSAFSR